MSDKLLVAAQYPELLEPCIVWVENHAEWAPYIIFILLVFAGFNLPVSEDLMIFSSAYLAVIHDELFWQLFCGVFFGAYFSDLICFGLGRFFGDKVWKVKFLAKMITPKRLIKIQSYYQRYGGLTLICGRFIPFGVRNGLFLTAGMGKMNFLKFAMYDLMACSVSVVTFFCLYLIYGQKMLDFVLSNNKYIFLAAVVVVLIIVLKKKLSKKSVDTTHSE